MRSLRLLIPSLALLLAACAADNPQCASLQALQCRATPRPLPAFELLAHDRQPFTQENLKGRWTLVFIGFVHCPDICPTTLAQLVPAQRQWAHLPEASRPRLLFVSVDPERDSPELVGRYAHGFHPDTLAATGELPQLEAFARSLGLVFMKQPPPDPAVPGHYAVDHSAALAVVDPEGRLAAMIPAPAAGFDVPAIVADLARLSETAR